MWFACVVSVHVVYMYGKCCIHVCLHCVMQGCCDAELVEVVQILEWMAQSKRVSLSISFLSRPEKHCLQEIFNRLEQKGVQVDFKDKFIQ